MNDFTITFSENEIKDVETALIWASRYHKEFNRSVSKPFNNDLLDRFQQLINRVNIIRHKQSA